MQGFILIHRRLTALLRGGVLTAVVGCVGAPVDVAPELPPNPPIPAHIRAAAFVMDVNTLRKTVTVSAPSASVINRASAARFSPSAAGAPSLSLLGGDAVDLFVTNFSAGAVGEVVPGKVLVTFDLLVYNKLAGYELTTPTFPTPPSGITGVLAFPIEISVSTTPGSVTTVGSTVLVSSPRFGAVVHSNNWDGDLHNFFNDVGCTVTATDCYRYEQFGNIAPLGNSAYQQVGFLIDPTVGDFRVKVILGADLVPTVTPTPGTIRGTLTSNVGPLAGAVINVTGGFSGVTDALGTYVIANVSSGNNKVISVQNLPIGCTAVPASYTVSLPAGGSFTQHFSASCAVPLGVLTGTITSSIGGALNGVQVTITPTGGASLPMVITNAAGAWTPVGGVPYLPNNDGVIVLGNLPAGCVNAGPYLYSGLSAVGLTRDIVVTCAAAPVTYALSGTWGAITNTGPTGRQVTLTVAIDMGLAPGSLAINGANADDLSGIGFAVAYDGIALDWISRVLLSPEFDLGNVVETGQGTSSALASATVGSSSGQTKTGSVLLMRLTFNIAAGFTGTVTPGISVSQALATTSDVDVTSSVIVTIAPLVIP